MHPKLLLSEVAPVQIISKVQLLGDIEALHCMQMLRLQILNEAHLKIIPS